MKNIQGNYENLELYNKEGKVVYKYSKDSNGYCYEYTYNDKGNQLTYKDSNGYWNESTYDDKGNRLTYKDSYGTTRGFNILEYTMEELVSKLGNFKIKK